MCVYLRNQQELCVTLLMDSAGDDGFGLHVRLHTYALHGYQAEFL